MPPVRPMLVLGTLVGALACGKRGDPQPPLRVVPQPVAEFQLAQRGGQLEITGVAPTASTAGARLPVLDLELLRATGPGDFERLARKTMLKLAPGEAFVEREPLPPPGTLIRTAASAVVNGRASRRTNVLSLTAWPPLAPPSDLTATLTIDGVALRWTPAPVQPTAPPAPQPSPAASASPLAQPPAPVLAGSPAVPAAAGAARAQASPPASAASPLAQTPASVPADRPAPPAGPGPVPAPGASPSPTPSPQPTPPPKGFSVYRRPKEGSYGRPLAAQLIPEPDYLDRAVQPGQDWCYSVRFAAQPSPPIESDASNEACVSVRDISPPAVPAGLALIRGPEGIEISWIPSTDPDLAGYRVYRAVEPTEPAEAPLLTELSKDTTLFRDTELRPGLVHTYFVTTVDAAGNESPRSEALRVRP